MTGINFQQALQQAANVSFEPLPNGTYSMVCSEAKPAESSTNKPMIKMVYVVESGPSQGKKVFNNQTFSADNDTALAIFFRHMAFHGLDANFFLQNPGWDQVAAALVGKRVRLELGTREWQGQPRNEVLKVLPPEGAAAGIAPTAPSAPTAAPVMAPVQPVQPQFPAAAPTPAPMITPVITQPPAPVQPQFPQPATQPVAPPMQPAPQQFTQPPMPQPVAPVGPPQEFVQPQPVAAQPVQQMQFDPSQQVQPMQQPVAAPAPVAPPAQPWEQPAVSPEGQVPQLPQLPEIPS